VASGAEAGEAVKRRSEVRGRKSEVRGRRAEAGGRRSEVRGRRRDDGAEERRSGAVLGWSENSGLRWATPRQACPPVEGLPACGGLTRLWRASGLCRTAECPATAARIGLRLSPEGSWQACPPVEGLPASGGPRRMDPPAIQSVHESGNPGRVNPCTASNPWGLRARHVSAPSRGGKTTSGKPMKSARSLHKIIVRGLG